MGPNTEILLTLESKDIQFILTWDESLECLNIKKCITDMRTLRFAKTGMF